ncbi:ribonuclease H-like domain-containing protein [Tanacetum coccineum]
MVTCYCVRTNNPTQRLSFHVFLVLPLPKSYHDAFTDLNWQNTMRDEYNALIKNRTWILDIYTDRMPQLHGMDTTYLLIYVDDIVLTASSQPLLQRIIASLHQEFSITDLGSINYVLGISVTRDSSGMCLPQRKYDVDVSPLLNRSLQPIKDDSQDV